MWETLSDDELRARLVQRRIPGWAAEELVAERDDPAYRELIEEALR